LPLCVCVCVFSSVRDNQIKELRNVYFGLLQSYMHTYSAYLYINVQMYLSTH